MGGDRTHAGRAGGMKDGAAALGLELESHPVSTGGHGLMALHPARATLAGLRLPAHRSIPRLLAPHCAAQRNARRSALTASTRPLPPPPRLCTALLLTLFTLGYDDRGRSGLHLLALPGPLPAPGQPAPAPCDAPLAPPAARRATRRLARAAAAQWRRRPQPPALRTRKRQQRRQRQWQPHERQPRWRPLWGLPWQAYALRGRRP